jgi:hypothetical protein
MRYLVILAACGLLCGCEAIRERVKEHDARLMAEDSAKCQSFGAQPGTDTYVQCMVGLAQVRATQNAGAASADAIRRANERRSITILHPRKPVLTALWSAPFWPDRLRLRN